MIRRFFDPDEFRYKYVISNSEDRHFLIGWYSAALPEHARKLAEEKILKGNVGPSVTEEISIEKLILTPTQGA